MVNTEHLAALHRNGHLPECLCVLCSSAKGIDFHANALVASKARSDAQCGCKAKGNPQPTLNAEYFSSPQFNALSPLSQVFQLGQWRQQQGLDDPDDTLPDPSSYTDDTASSTTATVTHSDEDDVIPPVVWNWEQIASEDREAERLRRHRRNRH